MFPACSGAPGLWISLLFPDSGESRPFESRKLREQAIEIMPGSSIEMVATEQIGVGNDRR